MSTEAPSKTLSPKTLPLGKTIAFSSLSMPLSALGLAIAVYLGPHYATNLGVSLTLIGAAWGTVRLLDLAVDVALAAMMDRTRTPWGRYRVWLVAGVPIMALAVWMLFIGAPHGFSSVWLVSWLLVYYLGTSIVGLAHSAWAAKLAPNSHGRSRLFGALNAIGVLGAVVAIAIPIVSPMLKIPDSQTIPLMGWLVVLTLAPCALIVAFTNREPIEPDDPGAHLKLTDYGRLFMKPDLLRMFLAQMALTLGPGWMSALYIFFFRDSRGFDGGQLSILLGIYIFAGIAGAPATARAAMRFGKHRTLMVTTTAYSLGLMTVLLIPKGSMGLAAPMMFWCGAMASGFDLMIRAMLADVGDEVRLEQGREQMSLIYAINTLAAKIASAFAIILTYPLLDKLGYVPALAGRNTPQAIHNLEMSYIIGPIVFVMLGGACVIGWKLNAERHGEIRAELERRDALYAEAPVIETLEGPSPVVAK